MILPDSNQSPREVDKIAALGRVVPRRPADLVVLAIRVVVASLRVSELVAAADHRHTDRQQQRGHDVSALPVAQLQDSPIRGGAFDPAVPAEILILAVTVLLGVRVVVFVVVADKVRKREAVVRRDEVDARIRTPAALLVEIAAAGESRRKLRDDAAVTAPEPAHRIAVLAVPFGPF